MTQEEKTILEQFPKYDNIPEHFVNSREYWEGIFKFETNRGPELHNKFSKLHKDIVQLVVNFCKENNLKDVSEFYVDADGLQESIECGKWVPSTDSSMWILRNREYPFLHEM